MGTSPDQTLLTPHRMPAVDALRLIAALMVLCFHYLFCGYSGTNTYSPLAFPALAPIAKYGFLGVHWFFMISGLVIAYSSVGRAAPQFAAARASRLLPGAWASIIFLFLVFTFFPLSIFPTNLKILFANLTFIPQLFHAPMQSTSFWSIQTELIFYILVGVLIAHNLWHRTLWIISVWLMLSGINLVLHIKILNYIFLTGYGSLFCLGMLLFHARQHGLHKPTIILMLLALGVATIGLLQSRLAFVQHYKTTLDPIVLIVLLYGMFGLLFLCLHIRLSGKWQRVCYILGGITYPLYLIHEALGYRIFWALQGMQIPAGTQFAITAITAIIIASLIWFFVEQPLIPHLRVGLKNFFARFFTKNGF